MMKFTWRVSPAPTGHYRSFERRSWPSAWWADGSALAIITCVDSYEPQFARSGRHAELWVLVANRDVDHDRYGAFRWRRLPKPASTLAEAKRLLEDFLAANPQFQR